MPTVRFLTDLWFGVALCRKFLCTCFDRHMSFLNV